MKSLKTIYIFLALVFVGYLARVGFYLNSVSSAAAQHGEHHQSLFSSLLHLVQQDIQNNSVVIAIVLMLILALLGTNIVISLLIAAVTGGLLSGMSLKTTLEAFNNGISNGANVALSYALLGAFAVAISKSGLPNALANIAIRRLSTSDKRSQLKWAIIFLIAAVSIASQNVIPIHIAFIPLLIPPLLFVMSQLNIDRRGIACVMAFGLITPYMFLPVGFGDIFLNTILLKNIEKGGVNIEGLNVMQAMAIPALGMVVGLLFALLVSYRRPRHYDMSHMAHIENSEVELNSKSITVSLVAIVFAFIVQLYSGSMILGALVGFMMFVVTRTIKWNEADKLFVQGVKMMASIGFVMITAQGFSQVIEETGKVAVLVQSSTALFGDSHLFASFFMMLIGLIVTMGVGSSFSTVPIIASIYTPLCVSMGYSPMATVCLIGAAAAIGDAGAPSSDTILATTSGLNVDGQHQHMRDSVIPTFMHFNIPLFLAGWFGSLIL